MSKLIPALITFAAFCCVSSAVYIFNDICDIESDKKHPRGRERPIASGKITVKGAAVLAVFLLCASAGALFFTNILTGTVVAAYIIENLIYTMVLKHRPIYDCFCIAAGFVFRICAGATASGLKVSEWLFLTVITMSLFMAFGKRRGEMLCVDEDNRRAVIESYDLVFLEGMTFVCAAITVVFYSLWALDRGMNMIYTVPLIIFIVCKYLLLIHDNNSHGDPTTVILSNKTLLCACGAYALSAVGLLYLFS